VRLIQCISCGTQNRIQGFSYSGTPICGKCRLPLRKTASVRAVRGAIKYGYWMALGAIVIGAIISINFKSPPKAESIVKKIESSNIKSTVPIIPRHQPVIVDQGVYRLYTDAELVAPLSIVTPRGPENYYIKLVDVSSGSPAISFFIFGGQSFETDVPLGTYRVKYATGVTWFGETHLFGSTTHYSEADKTFEFAVQGNKINGYTIELTQQRNGNLSTKAISSNQF
jgi:hypothetical protein